MCISCSHIDIRMQSVLSIVSFQSHFLNILLADRELGNDNTLPARHKTLAFDDQSECRLIFSCLQYYISGFFCMVSHLFCCQVWNWNHLMRCLRLAANPDVKWRNCSTQKTACQHSVYSLSNKQCFYCWGRKVGEAIIQNNHWKCEKVTDGVRVSYTKQGCRSHTHRQTWIDSLICAGISQRVRLGWHFSVYI